MAPSCKLRPKFRGVAGDGGAGIEPYPTITVAVAYQRAAEAVETQFAVIQRSRTTPRKRTLINRRKAAICSGSIALLICIRQTFDDDRRPLRRPGGNPVRDPMKEIRREMMSEP